MADATYQPKVYRQQGGDDLVVASGGQIIVESGGDLTVDSGGKIYNNGLLQHRSTVSSAAVLEGGGTSANPISTSSPSVNFFGLWTKSTDATGSDVRGLYWRHYISGAGASGDCARLYATLEGDGAVAARGAHVSLSFGAAGHAEGTAEALRTTLHVPDRAIEANGNYHALVVEASLDGNNAALTAATTHGLIQAQVVGGNQAAKRKFLNFLNLTGEEGGGYMVETIAGEPVWTSGCKLIRCSINGATKWIVCTGAVS